MQKKNKGLKIAIITILILIIILIATIAGLFLFTDIFKSDKEKFLIYGAQIFSNDKGLIDNDLIQYIEKKKNNIYQNTTDISFDMTLPESDAEQQKLVNNFNIDLEGKVDNVNNAIDQNISLNYSNDVNFAFAYRKTDGLKGFQTQYVGSKYIVKNEDEKIDELGIDLTQIENINFLEKIEIPFDKLQNVQFTYLSKFFELISNEKFSESSSEGKTEYKLSLTGEEFKNVSLQYLENLKNDENMINQINEIFDLEKSSSKITKSSIEDEIDKLNNEDAENLEITIGVANGTISGLKITYGNNEINLEKEKNNSDLKYNIIANIGLEENININVTLIADFTNILSENVTENYELSLGGDINVSLEESNYEQSVGYKYNLKNDVNFSSVDSIESFNDENSIILSKQDEAVKNNLITAIEQRMTEVNTNQMQELGIDESKNPINHTQPDYILQLIFTSALFSSMDIDMTMSEQEVTSFNSQFELYKGNNEKGVTVKGLLSTIALNNGIDTNNSDIEITEEEENNNPKITEINLNGEEYDVTAENITLLKSMIETESSYRVEFEADSETGLIYRAVINKI